MNNDTSFINHYLTWPPITSKEKIPFVLTLNQGQSIQLEKKNLKKETTEKGKIRKKAKKGRIFSTKKLWDPLGKLKNPKIF